MKRVLALMLILGIASTANAMYLEIDGISTDSATLLKGSTASITIISEDNSSWLGYLIVEEGGTGALVNPSILDAAGNLSSANPYSETGWGIGYELTAAESFNAIPALDAGPQFSFDYSGGLSGETATISLFMDPEYTIPADSMSVSIVPEPMTIALLGFGVLLLRRRK
jgi:hypothetical protein